MRPARLPPLPPTPEHGGLIVDLFAGPGGWSTGLRSLGLHDIGVEWDDAACRTRVTEGHLTIKGDVSQVPTAPFRGRTWLLIASPPCFPAGALVLTNQGYVPIKHVTVGTRVLTHKGRWRKVLATGGKVAPTVIVKGQGHPGLETTAEHPFWSRQRSGKCRRDKAGKNVWHPSFSEPEWTDAKDMAGKHWAVPSVYTEETLPVPPVPGRGADLTPEFWWMVGRWLGDGWARIRKSETPTSSNRLRVPYRPAPAPCEECDRPAALHKRFPHLALRFCGPACAKVEATRRNAARPRVSCSEVIICCSQDEADVLGKTLNAIAPATGVRVSGSQQRWTATVKPTGVKWHCGHSGLAGWLTGNFGRYAHAKRLPAWVLTLPEQDRQALLDGYVSTDGCGMGDADDHVSIRTVSRELAFGTRLLAESLGKTTTVGLSTPSRATTSSRAFIEGWEVNERPSYRVAWRDTPGRTAVRGEGHTWGLVRSVSPGQEHALVFNLEVEQDNTYVVEGVVVHNCQSWSLAGKQGGKPTAFLDALAGRYDDAYIARMQVDIGAQQAAYAAWSAAWAGVAGTRGWWADPAAADEVAGDPVAHLGGHDEDMRAAGADAFTDAGLVPVTGTRLTKKGAKARDAEFGPEPHVDDERGMFMAEVVRWIEGVGFPVHIALEQVPPVLPMWRLLASWLRDRGYSVWAGELNAANYGVPQTRRRAILLARRDGIPVSPPVASHAREADETEDLFGSVSEPWVSMAQALGWVPGGPVSGQADGTRTGRVPGAVDGRDADGWVVRTGSNSMSSSRDPMDMVPYERSVNEPAPTLDTQVGSKWQVGPPGSFKAAPHRWKHRPADPDGEDMTETLLAGTTAGPGQVTPAGSVKGRWEYVASELPHAARRDPLSDPAPTMAFGKAWMNARYEWVPASPADQDPDVGPQGKPLLPSGTGMPGTDAPGLPDRRSSADGQVRHSIKITIVEAAVLQSYPPDYRWWGSKGKQFEQVGNSVPPMLGRACIEAVTGRRGPSGWSGWAAAVASRPSDGEVLARYEALPEDVRVLLVPPLGATGTVRDSARAS